MGALQLLSNFFKDYRKQSSQTPISSNLVWRTRSIFYVLVILYTLIITFFFPEIQNDLQPIKLQEFIFGPDMLKIILLTAILWPLMEELFFRAGMVWWGKNVSFLVGSVVFLMLKYFLSDTIENLELEQFYRSLISYSLFLLSVVGSFRILKPFFPRISRVYARRPGWIFWILTLAFALAHITNFDTQNFNPLLILLVVPQFLLGIMLGFIRIQWGLRYAILIHIFHNTLQLIPLFILKQLAGGTQMTDSLMPLSPEQIAWHPRSIVLTGYGTLLFVFVWYHIVTEIKTLNKSAH
jgi:hypothetical protein